MTRKKRDHWPGCPECSSKPEDSFESLHAALRHTNERVAALETEVRTESKLSLDVDAEREGRIAALEYSMSKLEAAISVGAEDNGELDVRVRALESSMSKVRERVVEIVREQTSGSVTFLARRSQDIIERLNNLESCLPAPAARANENTVEGASSYCKADVGGSPPSLEPSTAFPASEVPSWVPSAEEIVALAPSEHPTGTAAWWRYFCARLRESLASRAPRPSPQPSVEEMAVLMHNAYWRNRASTGEPFDWTKDCTNDERGRWRDAAKAALSALPASASACDSCEVAWGIIANAHGGDWTKASAEWRSAAERWRDEWMWWRSKNAALPAPDAPKPASGLRLDSYSNGDKPATSGEPPTWKQIVQAVRAAEKAWAARQFGGEDTKLQEAQDAAVRALCLSRAPSPALAALVEKADALCDAVDESGWGGLPLHAAMRAYEEARASLGGAS